MRTLIRFGAILNCDVPKCVQSFVSYSFARLIRDQAVDAGWIRPKGKLVRVEPRLKKRVDICPDCRSLVMSDADLKREREIAKAAKVADKAKRKAERDAKKASAT